MPGYLGTGLTNGEVVYVPIPKNASSSHNATLKQGWVRLHFNDEASPYPAYVVVRHPVDRWFAGASTYSRRGKGKDLETMVEEVKAGRNPVYDEHTMRQSDYILSTLHEVELVRIESAVQYVHDNFGLHLPHVGGRATKKIDQDVVPALLDFYADDMILYEQAR